MSRNRVALSAVAAAVAAAVAISFAEQRHGRSAKAEIRSLLTTGDPVYCGGGKGPYVALTFDDGPTRWTPDLVKVLREHRARATFFEIGKKAVARPDLVLLESSVGEVGNHSWSHPSLTKLPNDRVVGQLVLTQNAVETISGERPNLYRPPFENHDARVDGIAVGLGLLDVLWNVDSGDASGESTPSAQQVAQNLVSRVRAGGIILLHEGESAPTSIDALKLFLPRLRQLGLHAVSVSDLLRLDPPDPAELSKGAGGCNSSWHG